MGRIRGFLLKHRSTTLFRRVFRRDSPESNRVKVKPLCRLIGWAHSFRAKAKAALTCPGRAGPEQVLGKPEPVPKGRMAVYVGQKDGDFRRVLVPVVYFNHPLFGELLRESENEFGFDQPGGLTIPCRVSEFERVQTRIKTGRAARKLLRWKSPNRNAVG